MTSGRRSPASASLVLAAVAVVSCCSAAAAGSGPPLPTEALQAIRQVRIEALRRVPIFPDPEVFSRAAAARPAAPSGVPSQGALLSVLARVTGGAEGLYQAGLTELSRDQLDEATDDFAQLRAKHAQDPRAGAAAFWLAEIRRRQGKLDEAIAFLRLAKGEREGEASCRLAALLDLQGRKAEARAAWERIAADSTGFCAPDAWAWLGADRLRAGDAGAARRYLEKALGEGRLPEGSPRRRTGALLPLALALSELGDPGGAERAIGQFLESPAEAGSEGLARLALGFALLEAGRTGDSRRVFSALLEGSPPAEVACRARYGRVRAWAEEGKPGEAASALGSPAPSEPWLPEAEFELAWAQFQQGDYGEALRWSRECTAEGKGAEAEAAAYLTAESLRRSGASQEALEAFAGLTPRSAALRPAALHGGGMAALASGKATEAAGLLDVLLRDYPAYSEADAARVALGEARISLGQPDEGLRRFEEVPRESPSYADALFQRGWMAFQGERWEEATSRLTEFVDAFPAEPRRDKALLALARSQFNRSSVRTAFAALDRLEAGGESDLRTASRFSRAWMLARSGDEGQARPLLAALLDEAPRGPYAARIHLTLAWLDTRKGDCASALTHCDAVIALAPGGEVEREARLKRAECLYEQRRFQEALEAYRGLGTEFEARCGEALCLAQLGRVEELTAAAEAFAADDRPLARERASDLYGLLGRELAKAGDPSRAAAALDHGARLTASRDKADRMRLEAARGLVAAGNADGARATLAPVADNPGEPGTEALRQLAQLAGEGPDAGAAWDRLAARVDGVERASSLRVSARQMSSRRDWEGARQRLHEALDSCPPDHIGLRQALLGDLGELELAAGKPGDALEPLGRAGDAGLGPEGLRALVLLARAQESAGRSDEALETRLRIGYVYPLGQPEVAEALFSAGERFEALGRLDRARIVYDAVSREAPPRWVEKARARLLSLPPSADK